MSALLPKADICSALVNVGYGPEADIHRCIVLKSSLNSARIDNHGADP